MGHSNISAQFVFCPFFTGQLVESERKNEQFKLSYSECFLQFDTYGFFVINGEMCGDNIYQANE